MQAPIADASATASSFRQAQEIERIRYFHRQNISGTFVGAIVLSLTVWANAPLVPTWTWLGGLLILYVITAVRGHLYWQYWHAPDSRPPLAWGRAHTIGAACAGTCWGMVNASMCIHLPVENQLMIVAVAAVSAAYAAAEGFAYTPPSRWFIIFSLTPLALWLYVDGRQLQMTLAVLLTIFIPLTLRQMHHRSQALSETLRLRFDNEALIRELELQKEIAESAALAKSRFLAIASHDLRQPMQALTIYHELLRNEMTLTERGKSFYARLQSATAAVSDLLTHLLDISRLDSGAVQSEPEVFPLAALFEQLRGEFEPLARAKGLQLRIAPCHAAVTSDPLLVGQILRNLLSNAVRYTPSGKILLGSRPHRGQIRIEVHDTGIGIAPNQQEAIFTEFYQVNNPHRDRQQGLGLGLAIVARLARTLGTHVAVHSHPGQGTCFAFSLPTGMLSTQHDTTKKDSADALLNKLVVLVENEEVVRNSMHALLLSMGCRVVAGPSSQSIIEQLPLPSPHVDIVISDFGISATETGFDVFERLQRHLGVEFQSLLMTGTTDRTIMEKANRAQISVLHKPIPPSVLQQALLALPGLPASASSRSVD